MSEQHRRRHAEWRRLGGQRLVILASLVEERLVRPLETIGFERVGLWMRDRGDPVSGREIHLERVADGDIEAITFNFDKYRRPAFQIHLQRRSAEAPHAFVRAANLVRRPRQHLHIWGKPWWLPTRFWSERLSRRTVDRLAGMCEQAVAFLERGECGPNISRPIDIVGQANRSGVASSNAGDR